MFINFSQLLKKLVINSFEQRIALPKQILFRDKGFPAKYSLSDHLVCIAVEFHGY